MIRQLTILAVAVICLTVSTRAADIAEPVDLEAGQKAIVNLLSHLYEGTKLKPEVSQRLTGQSIDAVNPTGSYPKLKRAIRKLEARISSGILPRGRIFSVFYSNQLDEAVLIFNVFYWAPTIWHLLWSIFCYYPRVNENQFNYALAVALMHRDDTKWLSKPQSYAIYPEYFFNSDVTKRIYDYKISHCNARGNLSLEANYTNWYISNSLDCDTDLTYFMEDVSLNTWYDNMNQRFPFWMSSKEYPNIDLKSRGENYYYIHKMLLNRHNMERIFHDLDLRELLNWDRPIMKGYSPYMAYKNGLHFPGRPADSYTPVWKNQYVNDLKQFESRIAGVVDSGLVMMKNGTLVSILNKEGIEILGNLVQGTSDSYNSRYYGSLDALGRSVLGWSLEPHDQYQILPSALEHFPTSLRDPGYYPLYTKINNYLFRYKKSLGPYTPAELDFEAVTINNVTISKQLVTYFEKVGSVIGSSNPTQPTVTVTQQRLNYDPYTYNIDVTSTKKVKASIRIFLGPKYDAKNNVDIIDDQKFNEIDDFVTELNKGDNIFNFASANAPEFAPDLTKSDAFHYVVGDAEKLAFEKQRFSFPSHLILPRGKPEGMPVQFLFFINEYVEKNTLLLSQSSRDDNKPLGFPLDRPTSNFARPNMAILDTKIFHRSESSI